MNSQTIEKRCQDILAKLKTANPNTADRFRLGARGVSVLYDIDDKKSAILCSARIDGGFEDCHMGDGLYPTIERNTGELR